MSDAGMNLSVEKLNTSDMNEDNKPELSATRSAGALLAAAREQKDWTVQHIADQLKLSVRQIIAIESNHFNELPKMVIVRGFIRSYAKLLKIDAEPIIELLPKENDLSVESTGVRPVLATPFLESRLPLMGRQDVNNGKYVWGAVVLAILALVFFVLQKYEHISYIQNLISPKVSSSLEAPASAATSKNSTNSVALDTASVENKSEGQVNLPSSEVASPNTSQSGSSSISDIVVPSTVSAPVLSSSTVNQQLADPAQAVVLNSANNLMKFKFRQDSWIQLKRENGSVVTSHLARAGTEESFDLKEPLQIKIGNAAGVDGTLRGVSLNIAPTKESNVFNLSVK
ncbi:cytoskeleton protein RodZ [Undibacterium sp. GrIS 1.8]|uniref:RodZ domain-containing protein n=1 Tax=unclassified Undibacterium TaxID=2630295 RepID=UPI0033953537